MIRPLRHVRTNTKKPVMHGRTECIPDVTAKSLKHNYGDFTAHDTL